MAPRFVGIVFAVIAAGCLLGGCPVGPSSFHLVLFNNTNDQVVFRRRAADPHPVVILACTGGDVTDVSTDDVTIERAGRVYHYRYPAAYTYPSEGVPSEYARRVRRLGKAFCLQLAPDNAIYLLQRQEPYTEFAHLAQPAGFPLEPVATDAAPVGKGKKNKSAGGPFDLR